MPKHATSKLALCCPLPDHVLPVFVQVISPKLAGLPCRLFWPYDTRSPSVIFEAVDVPCRGPLHFFLTLLIVSMTFCPLPDPDVGLSVLVCDVEHTSFYFGLRGRKFVMCLSGESLGLCTIIPSDTQECIPVSSRRWQCCF